MTATIKQKLNIGRQLEIRSARIKKSQQIISKLNISGLLNNTKWLNIFKEIEGKNLNFTLKLLSRKQSIHCKQIFELEQTNLLTDGFNDFIEFIEIEELTVSKPIFKEFLSEHIMKSIDLNDSVLIQGYR